MKNNAMTHTDTDRTDSSVPFRLEHMEMLIQAYDACMALEETARVLFGEDMALTYGRGVVGDLAYVEELIRRLSPLGVVQMEEDVDYTETELYKVLTDREIGLEERAKRILFPVG